MTDKVFRRTSDDGHASIFKSRMSADMVTIEIERPAGLGGGRITTVLDRRDARRFAHWILEKTEKGSGV